MTIDELETRITAIEKRNADVEENKAWETSLTRKVVLVILTYVIVSLTLIMIGNSSPFINAIIPSLGFFLSTLFLPIIKQYWARHIYSRR